MVSVRRTHQVTHPKPEHKAMRIHLLDGQIHSGTDITIAPDLAQKSLSLYQSTYSPSLSLTVSHSLYLSSLLSLFFSLSLPHQPTPSP